MTPAPEKDQKVRTAGDPDWERKERRRLRMMRVMKLLKADPNRRCGAFARSTGQPCRCKVFGPWNKRCRLHGGRHSGTGIGLAIVQQGVERMGGRVGVDSTPGQGSRFWFELRKA